MKRNKKIFVTAAALMSLLLISCGNASNEPVEETQQTAAEAASTASSEESSAAEEKPSSEPVKEQAESAPEAEKTEQLSGEWTFIYSNYHSEYSDGDEYDSITMCTDPYAPESAINIREDNGKLLIDYKMQAYESDYRFYGLDLQYKDEPAYEGCENKDWCMQFSEPFGEKNENEADRKITLIDDETLIEVEEYFSEEDSEFSYHSITTNTYLRSDSPRLKDMEGLRYFNTVTVSDTAELLNNIANNTKIILKKGKYDFSDVAAKELNNKNVTESYGAYTVNGISNLCLEAEEGADVLLCIDTPDSPVLTFDGGNNITMRGITAGHNVEPGYCGGSVLYYSGVTGVEVYDCKLYGSGTYGIEASSCSNMKVEDSEIYECTYGLLSLSNVYTASFKNCVMRDSCELSMIYTNSCYEIVFEDCEFRDNDSRYDYCYFIEQDEYDDVTFKKCKFKNNKYYLFSNYQVKMEDCDMENNNAKLSDIINFQEIDDASDLLSLYEDAKKRQEEIDKKLESDTALDQLSLNQLSFEEYDMWDSLLNRIWSYLGNTLDESTFEALTSEQKEWIKTKETAQKDAGADFEGGSMQPMIENEVGAEKTQKRVKYLVEKYLDKQD